MSSLTRILLFFILMLPCCHAASGQTPYSRLELKADRFFSQGEWAQAAATYYQMLEARPDVAATYGKAIVANAVRGDTLAEMELMVKALNAKVPFDSVLSRVRSTSFSLGKSNLYGDFLLRVKEAYPWMRRPMDNYLLRYYSYRKDGAKMVEYSRMMLQGDPSNTAFLMSLAQGAMLCGDYAQGVRAYESILAVSPADYDALVALGNYYYIENRAAVVANASDGGDASPRLLYCGPYAEKARTYLARANEVHHCLLTLPYRAAGDPPCYLRPKSAGISPHIGVFQRRMGLRGEWERSQRFALASISKIFLLRSVGVS